MGDKNAYRLLVGKPDGKRPLRTSHRWVDNKMDLRERGWDGMGWIGMA
jgi:hypothetical protein